MFATDKQINFINSLTGKIGETLATRVIFDTLPNFRGFALLSKRDASKVIDALIDARDNQLARVWRPMIAEVDQREVELGG